MRRALALAALVALAAAPALAQAPASPRAAGAPPTGASFAARALAALPVEIGQLRREGAVTDFEARPGGAGLGASVRLVPREGAGALDATLFLYDRGDARRPDGGANPDLPDELRIAVAEMADAVARGVYREVEPVQELQLGAGADGRPAARCVTFRVVHRNGTGSGDAACVTVHRAHFLKTRLTLWAAPDPTAAGLGAAALLVQARDLLR